MVETISQLEDRLQRRREIEAKFARMGHTYRHGPLHRFVDQRIVRPGLTAGLRTLGLYQRGRRNAISPIIRHMRFDFDNLPSAFDGFQVIHLSDFHIDGVDGLAEALASQLAKLSCDLCVFTGDYRFEDRGSCDRVYPRMQTIIKSIRSRHGIYGILGNHDPGELALPLQDMGVNMLVNDSARIEQNGDSIWVVGLDDNFDYETHDFDLAQSEVSQGAFQILLAHAPELFVEAEARGVQLVLGGHTHGGQVRLPFIGALKQNARCPKEYAWGSWKHGKLQGYTSCGVGCSTVPVRFNCPPEIVLLELRRSSS